jgi:DNA-binding winged helix-turn-helix (wHTH) protein
VLRYRFSHFTLSPQRRLLLRDDREVPLIPRYFDLLLLLVERRREAVHRREIFDLVWANEIVSDSALSQAVRTIRRTLGDDDPREPRYIRTVSRHGYQFVFPEVLEEDEGQDRPAAGIAPSDAISEIVSAAVSADRPEDLDRERAMGRRPVTTARAGAGGALAGVLAGARRPWRWRPSWP